MFFSPCIIGAVLVGTVAKCHLPSTVKIYEYVHTKCRTVRAKQ